MPTQCWPNFGHILSHMKDSAIASCNVLKYSVGIAFDHNQYESLSDHLATHFCDIVNF